MGENLPEVELNASQEGEYRRRLLESLSLIELRDGTAHMDERILNTLISFEEWMQCLARELGIASTESREHVEQAIAIASTRHERYLVAQTIDSLLGDAAAKLDRPPGNDDTESQDSDNTDEFASVEEIPQSPLVTDLVQAAQQNDTPHDVTEDVLVEPGRGGIITGSGKGVREPRFEPRFDSLLEALHTSDIDTSGMTTRSGIVHPGMMRRISYALIRIPSVQKQILVCDQVGEVTLVSDGTFDMEAFCHCQKDQLLSIGAQPVEHRNQQWWLNNIFRLLREPIPSTERDTLPFVGDIPDTGLIQVNSQTGFCVKQFAKAHPELGIHDLGLRESIEAAKIAPIAVGRRQSMRPLVYPLALAECLKYMQERRMAVGNHINENGTVTMGSREGIGTRRYATAIGMNYATIDRLIKQTNPPLLPIGKAFSGPRVVDVFLKRRIDEFPDVAMARESCLHPVSTQGTATVEGATLQDFAHWIGVNNKTVEQAVHEAKLEPIMTLENGNALYLRFRLEHLSCADRSQRRTGDLSTQTVHTFAKKPYSASMHSGLKAFDSALESAPSIKPIAWGKHNRTHVALYPKEPFDQLSEIMIIREAATHPVGDDAMAQIPGTDLAAFAAWVGKPVETLQREVEEAELTAIDHRDSRAIYSLFRLQNLPSTYGMTDVFGELDTVFVQGVAINKFATVHSLSDGKLTANVTRANVRQVGWGRTRNAVPLMSADEVLNLDFVVERVNF